ncbi:MAG: histidine phosphatase family protein [Sphingomonadales bacterium]
MLTGKTLFLARHAETVFNRSARLQGNEAHTPLTSGGVRQAIAMADALKDHLGSKQDVVFWASPTGRTRQTAAVIADALDIDYFSIRFDDRLKEIDVGDWTGRTYADVTAECGPIVDASRRLFIQRPPGGEWYDDMVGRLSAWAQDVDKEAAPMRLAVSHGLASRVLRGVITGQRWHADIAATVADDIPQGHFCALSGQVETCFATSGPASHGRGF